ncbi:MAG: hypothetical protein K6T16_01230 [Candidatus Pacearchaeota archaeon]|nr:hypothetical protein [Candidatus Pacearchaeota archaeon]
MRKINVYPLFGEHAIYTEILAFPPRQVQYMRVPTKGGEGYYKTKKLKEAASKLLGASKLPRMAFLPKIDADIIHSSRGILILNKMPWVIDIEHPFSFTHINQKLLKNRFTKWIIEKFLSSRYCKKIMPHCEASKNALIKYLNSKKIINKIEVLYPATHIIKNSTYNKK